MKNVKTNFFEYLSGMEKICYRSLLLTFTLGILAIIGVAVMMIIDRSSGINIIEAEITSIILYIFRSVCITEFFLLLFDFAARTS